MRHLLFACAAIGLASPLAAQPAAPSEQSATADAQRMALARTTVDHIWPLGTYARMMNGTMDKMMDGLMGSMFDMKMDQLAAGMSAEERKALDDKGVGQSTMRELMLKADPHFEERLRLTNKTMWAEMTPLLTRLEPSVREGLTRAYARKFNAEQLADLNRFFATPSGRVYASESMLLFMDREVMTLMARATPLFIKEMPAILKKVEAATAHLPPPPKPATDGDEQTGEEEVPTS